LFDALLTQFKMSHPFLTTYIANHCVYQAVSIANCSSRNNEQVGTKSTSRPHCCM